MFIDVLAVDCYSRDEGTERGRAAALAHGLGERVRFAVVDRQRERWDEEARAEG